MSQASLTIRLREVSLRFDGTTLFSGLGMDLTPGWTCLLGPSGVGKSSLLKYLAGLLPADIASGHIQTDDGRPLSGRLAFMAQQDLLLPWLTVAGNVALGPRLRGEPTDTSRVSTLLEQVGLAGYHRRLPGSLSGGQRQRVALARTLLEDHPLVLLDEPFASLDAITRYRLQSLAARLLRGRTVLLVTHDPLEALRLGDSLYVLSGQPPRLGAPLCPPGPPPRPPGQPELAALHGELLRQLAAEHAPCAD